MDVTCDHGKYVLGALAPDYVVVITLMQCTALFAWGGAAWARPHAPCTMLTFSAMSLAVARPMPEEAPVTTTAGASCEMAYTRSEVRLQFPARLCTEACVLLLPATIPRCACILQRCRAYKRKETY